MRFGFHLGISGGLKRTAEYALASTCDCLQIFSSNPTAWRPGRLDEAQAQGFATVCREKGLYPIFLHTPYLINLASSRPDFYEKSLLLLQDAMYKAGRLVELGVPGPAYVVSHIGSHQGAGVKEGCHRVSQGLAQVLADAPDGTIFLIENNPGSGTELAHTFEEYVMILEPLERYHQNVGVALDTAHLWGAGYDISTKEAVDTVLADFHRQVGLERLHLFHLNDSIYGLGSRNDEHVHPGEGTIGLECFQALVTHPDLEHVSMVQELPGSSLEENRRLLQMLRDMRANPK